MIRIWFNHWFSTAYSIMGMLKKDNPEFYIIGTNEREHSVLSVMCDEWYTEPALRGDSYVDFCLEFCEQHQVDVFLPRRGLLDVSRRKREFEATGIRVMVDDYEIVNILNHKDLAYRELAGRGVSTIPDYEIVTNAMAFETAYAALSQKYRRICMKFIQDEGGKSYRLIDNERRGYTALFKKQSTRMTYAAAVEALSERESFPPLMVMPNLPGEEISVDCLQTGSGLIMLPRIKDSTRIERLCFQEDVLAITQEVYNAIRLEWPCNIQFKYLGDTPYFLEVNTRMSGGIQMACAAGEVNLPSIAVHKLLGIEKRWSVRKEERCVSHVEIPIIL